LPPDAAFVRKTLTAEPLHLHSGQLLGALVMRDQPAPPEKNGSVGDIGNVLTGEAVMRKPKTPYLTLPTFHFVRTEIDPSRPSQRSPLPLSILPAGQGRSAPLTTAGASRGQRGSQRHAQRSDVISQFQTSMTYIQEFEAELAKRVESAEAIASIVRWASEKVLESYRNGITAGQKGAQVIRKGESRRSGLFGKAPKEASSRAPRQ
jgi:hypothetical protein